MSGNTSRNRESGEADPAKAVYAPRHIRESQRKEYDDFSLSFGDQILPAPRPSRVWTCIFAAKIDLITELTENPRSAGVAPAPVAIFYLPIKGKTGLCTGQKVPAGERSR